MIKLHYKLIDFWNLTVSPVFLLSRIEDGTNEKLQILFSEEKLGFVTVNGKKYKITNKKAEIDFSDIPEGISTVEVIEGTRVLCASPFLKDLQTIKRLPLDDVSFKAFEDSLLLISEKLDNADERIKTLEEKIIPKNMFVFSQN